MANEIEQSANLTPTRAALALGVGLASGLLIVLGPYALVWAYSAITHHAQNMPFTAASGFNSSLTLLFPLVQGFGLGMALGPRKYDFGIVALLVLMLVGIELFGAWIFLREGIICLIILSPLAYTIVLAGALLGRVFARRVANRALHASLIPLAMLAVFAEAAGPRPDYANAISDSVVIDAPPDHVWRYVLSYPENTSPPEYWLWQIGLPYPTQSIAEAPRVGATRVCTFNTGIGFEERIVELTPNESMTFEVTRQPDHPEVTGHFQFDRGQIRLTRNADGTTTVTATSWYHLFVRPAAYFDWWTADITRQVHFRVLNHVRALAERDYRARES